MCGIFGVLTQTGDVREKILEGLNQLQNRGYDSCGMGLLEDGSFLVKKYAQDIKKNISALDELRINSNILEGKYTVGVGHNRWATHGEKSDINAHPHISNNGTFIIVHNGIIENYSIIKKRLVNEENYVFTSQTDTEVIVALMEYHYKNGNTKEAINKTIGELVGTYGLVIINIEEPNKIYCVRNGSPILIGLTDDTCIITSEQSGFCNHVNTYITLENEDICCISRDKTGIHLDTDKNYNKRNLTIMKRNLTPAPYNHWTIKEIHEQPLIVENAINRGGRIKNESAVKLGGLDGQSKALEQIENIIILGCGSSFNAGECGSYFMKILCKFNSVQVIDGAELTHYDLPNKGKTAFIMISQSGETKDLHRCMNIAHDNNIMTIGVINVIDSQIARETDCGIYCNSGIEVGVASTKSFVSQVICVSMIALWFSEKHNTEENLRKKVIKSLRNLANDIKCTLANVEPLITPNLPELNLLKINSMFILGKGCDAYISNEGALKIKELTYIHSEGYSSSALKHGPFALLTEDTPVVLLNCDDTYSSKIMNCYEEISSRNAPVLLITDNQYITHNIEKIRIIPVANNEYYGFILGLIPLQLLSYYISVEKGYNPDTPRNLAKVVTVE
jgi:glucosamine--fructose-6-phosphate aminotransferase (isomerizing)